jgi:hypothetical protein
MILILFVSVGNVDRSIKNSFLGEDVVENHLEFLLVVVHFSNKSERSNILRMQSSCRVDLVLLLPSQVADAGKKEKRKKRKKRSVCGLLLQGSFLKKRGF